MRVLVKKAIRGRPSRMRPCIDLGSPELQKKRASLISEPKLRHYSTTVLGILYTREVIDEKMLRAGEVWYSLKRQYQKDIGAPLLNGQRFEAVPRRSGKRSYVNLCPLEVNQKSSQRSATLLRELEHRLLLEYRHGYKMLIQVINSTYFPCPAEFTYIRKGLTFVAKLLL